MDHFAGLDVSVRAPPRYRGTAYKLAGGGLEFWLRQSSGYGSIYFL